MNLAKMTLLEDCLRSWCVLLGRLDSVNLKKVKKKKRGRRGHALAVVEPDHE